MESDIYGVSQVRLGKNDYSLLSSMINTLNAHNKYLVSIYHFVCRSIMATDDARLPRHAIKYLRRR
jgi:hypothetical protein